MKLVECVPNISEGKDTEVIAHLRTVLARQPGCTLLHIDSSQDANRTVFTWVVPEERAVDCGFAFIEAALRLIDMRHQRGEHVRNGAVDVFPLVPLGQTTMETCVSLSRTLARQVGDSLLVPVYLYGNAAQSPNREKLSYLRRGGYETLVDRLALEEWKPDAGTAKWTDAVAAAGSVQIGARPIMIAWNINLETDNVRIARRIAARIRTSGSPGKRPGMFPELMAKGWHMPEYGCAQVTMNLLDYAKTPLKSILDAVGRLALEYGTHVTGSEPIGLLPLDALLTAGQTGLPSDQQDSNENRDSAVRRAINLLGLDALSVFEPQERVLELRLAAKQGVPL